MSQVPAGWFPDPYGRYQQRWWDGADWTASVSTDGVPITDPMGNSPVIPFATPPTALPGGAADSGGSIRLLDTMGMPARERQRPSLRHAVAGLGGAILAGGAIILSAGESTNRTSVTIVGAALVVVAWLLRRFVRVEELAAAAVGMVVIGVAAFVIGLTVSDTTGGFLTGLLAALLFLALWVAPGFRGHNLLLALGLNALLAAFGSLSGGLSNADNTDALLPSGLTDTIGRQGAIYLVGAALLLAGTWWLDRRGYRGAGTALCASGLSAAGAGVVLLLDNFGEISGPLFVLAVGLAVCVVGSHGGRRTTTWTGAALVAGGMVALIIAIVKPDSTQAAGITGLVAGALLVAVPLAAAPLRRRAQAAVSDGSDARP
jgi:hypothetical protein